MQIPLHQVRSGRQRAAIDVVDEENRGEQENDGAAGSPCRIDRRWDWRAQLA
jgi:hypothetical protein